MSLKDNNDHEIQANTDEIELEALVENRGSAYDDMMKMVIEAEAERSAIEAATGIKPLEIGVDIETPKLRDQLLARQTIDDDNEEDEDVENIAIAEEKMGSIATLSQLSEQLTVLTHYEEFEKKEAKKLSVRDSWDIYDSSDISESEYPITQKDLPTVETVMKPNEFLKTFKDIAQLPNITELSLESLRAPTQVSIPKSEAISELPEDPGHFVDPLTGDIVESDHKLEQELTYSIEESLSASSASTSAESEIILQVSEDDNILMEIEKIDERGRALQPEKPDEDLAEKEMAAFLEEIAHVPSEHMEMRFSEILRQQQAQEKTKKLIVDFLDALIGRVVHEVEYIDPIAVLRKNLDKSKLLAKLVQLVFNLRMEQRMSAILNRKVAEHFRRKKAFRNITEVSVDLIKEEMQKYYHQLENLDLYLGYELDATNNKNDIERKLENQLQKLTDLVQGEFENFEGLVRKAFMRPDASERYVHAINTLIKRIKNQRHEVTEFRRDLIYKQSMIAQLNKDLENLEHLGEGLYLNEYNHKLTETIGLTKLLDEKEFQTAVMRKRCHEALHTVTHMMENISMEKSLASIHEKQLKRVEDERLRLREELYYLKIQHLKMMQETAQLHYQGGLIGKPSILLDYDKITDEIPAARKRIENLKSVYENLCEKVKILGKKCGIV